MKLWLLKPRKDSQKAQSIWNHYAVTHGFVIRAESEVEAREMAKENTFGIEDAFGGDGVWLDPNVTDCIELTSDGSQEIVMMDYQD